MKQIISAVAWHNRSHFRSNHGKIITSVLGGGEWRMQRGKETEAEDGFLALHMPDRQTKQFCRSPIQAHIIRNQRKLKRAN